MRTVWILGDQLHEEHPGLAAADRATDRVLMIESLAHSGQVRHHQVKLVLVLAAMRHRAAALRAEGWRVDYVQTREDFLPALKAHIAEHRPELILVQEPGGYGLSQNLPEISRQIGVPLEVLPTNQFLVSREEFKAWARDSERLLMENHYRRMRKKLSVLLEPDGQPVGGAWNFDADNRETFAALKRKKLSLPKLPGAEWDETIREVIALVEKEFAGHPGKAANFWLPVTRAGAKAHLREFVARKLAFFGPHEDVMVEGEPVLFHSVLSPLLNIGLLTPLECVEAAVEAFEKGRAPLASVEGFVRQIIGWREFINGVYWQRMPRYKELNALEAHRALPGWIYTGETRMNCLHQTIRQVVEFGYGHHIQRLMVLGNFFLLGGFEPKEVYRWYLEMYVDGHDWVMAANVIGMILHADGGYMTTKPYAAGSGYINKMSNYCKRCPYRPEVRTGPDACPFNFLYWNFYDQHQARFAENPRVGMMIQTWKRKTSAEQEAIREQARVFLDAL